MHPSAAILVLLVALAAGCLGTDGDGDAGSAQLRFAADWSERALPSSAGHDHDDPLQHAGLTTPNFEVVGRDPLFSEHYGGQSAGGYVCADAKDTGERRIAAVESRSQVGFALADVTDPASPRWLGELVMENTYVYDLAVLPGAQHVVLVTRHAEVEGLPPLPPVRVADDADSADAARQSTTSASHGSSASLVPSATEGESLDNRDMTWQTPCDPLPRQVPWLAPSAPMSPEDPLPRPMSLVLVDITDPSSPAVVDQHPILGYGHSAYAERFGEDLLVLVTTLGPPLGPTSASAFELYTLVATPLGPRLEPVSVYRPPAGTSPLPPTPLDLLLGRSGHDSWMAVHPGTGQLLAYLVGADLFTILDLSNPRSPVVVGTWSEGPGREGYSGSLHSVVPLPELRTGRHYTIVGPEFGGHPTEHPSGIVWVLDTTNPRQPFEVAAWTLPHDVEWNGTYMFSNHYYGVHQDTLFVSMYHGGVWAVDLSPLPDLPQDAPFLLLDSVGVFLPTDPEADPAVEVRWTPNLQEVLTFEDGTLLTFDSWTGLWTFRFDASAPAPPPEPWPIEPVSPR